MRDLTSSSSPDVVSVTPIAVGPASASTSSSSSASLRPSKLAAPRADGVADADAEPAKPGKTLRERFDLSYVAVVLWIVNYVLMTYAVFARGAVVVPFRWWGKSFAWEIVDGFTEAMGQRPGTWKKRLHTVFALQDAVIMTKCVLHGNDSVLEMLAWTAAYCVVALVTKRQYKYFEFTWFYPQWIAMLKLPGYAELPELQAAAWIGVVAQFFYAFKYLFQQHSMPKPRVYYMIAAVLLPLHEAYFAYRRCVLGDSLDEFTDRAMALFILANVAYVAVCVGVWGQ